MSPRPVRLIGVSKTVGPAEIEAALAAGLTDFGENRAQPFKERQAAFPQADWHFIGRIQTNKVKDFVGRAAMVHSVASERALAAIDRRAAELGCVQALLIEVNVSGEASKDGVSPGLLPALLEQAASCPAVLVAGLMTIAPIAADDVIRRSFAGLRELGEAMRSSFAGAANLPLYELSMGMSDDFVLAVQEGATMIRIGRGVWK